MLLRNFFIAIGFFIITDLSAETVQAAPPEPVLQSVANEIRTQLSASVSTAIGPDLDKARLVEFYKERSYSPVWVDKRGPLLRAQILRETLLAVEQDGLYISAFHPVEITPLWNSRSARKLARLELLLTDAFFRYSEHLLAGQFQENDFYWDIPAARVDPIAELRKLLAADNFQSTLQNYLPSYEGYRRLREALKRYRQIEVHGGWPELPPGPLLKPGGWNDQIVVLRQRLIAEGDLETGPVKDARYFDDAVKLAVERFQVRHGLEVDGVVGDDTRAAANVTVSERIKQIRYNMERWRWLPRQLGERYIMVNIADFSLVVVEDEVVQMAMSVIIGRPSRPTPVTSSAIHTVVVNPYWTLPQTIIFEDVLPIQKRNPNYFKSKNIRVFSNGQELDSTKIDWSKANRNHFPYILRQDPGPGNSLGRLKFLFGNNYSVYLHDTPDRHLFNRNNRALSSGCIRVEQPMQLASNLLGRGNGWSVEKIRDAINSGERQEVPLPESIPIYLVYLTAWAGENQGVHFRPDIYDRDPKVRKCVLPPEN